MSPNQPVRTTWSPRGSAIRQLSQWATGKTYHIRTFGCQLNENDAEKIAGMLEQAGMRPADVPDDADFILLNTCSVREHADDRLYGNLGRLKGLKSERPGVLIGLCGCMMTQQPHQEKIRRSFPWVDLVFGTSDLHKVPELLLQVLEHGRMVMDVSTDRVLAEGLPVRHNRRFRALCSIMYGCDNFCSYCIVPYTRGRERSRRPEDIRQELAQIAAEGFREVMLLGQNVNSYGNDLRKTDPDAPGFPEILSMAASFPGFAHVRFMTSHPKDIDARLLDVIAANPSVERHLHLPLQSGSNRILEQMNRKYTREQYLETAQAARVRIPDLTISTDLIVGFPGETEEDFQDTLRLMDTVRFDNAFTFLYSPREGTPAAQRTDQVDPEVARDRFQRLIDLQQEHSLASHRSVLDARQQVLIEGPSAKPGVWTGRTTHNRLVNFTAPGTEADADLENCLGTVRITEAHPYYLEGILEGSVR